MKKKLNCILLIDDDDSTNFIHKRLIKKTGYTEIVKAVESAEAGIDFLKHKVNGEYPCPELIFLDINMPGMSGWDFLEEYDKLEDIQKGRIVVVMLTTSLNPDDEEKSKKIPTIKGFMNKPLTKEGLMDIVQRHFPENF